MAGDSPQRQTRVNSRTRLWLAMALAGLVAFGAAAAGLDVRASYGARVTGDEPYYLITAISLAEDRDLDVSDEIAKESFRPFHEIPLDEQTRPLEGGRRVSPHDPLLPLLLAPAVALGGWVGAKLLLAAAAGGLGALLVWIAVRRFQVGIGSAALAAVVFGASAPLAVYGNQVYPELPAAVCVAAGVAALTGRLGTGGLICLAASITALPWLSIKYAPVAATLTLIALVMLARARRVRAAAALGGGLVVMGIVFVAAHLVLYGGLTPYAVGDHFTTGEFGVVGSQPDYAGRSRRLVGLLVDRDFGLAAWQPAWLLVVPAFVSITRARPRGWQTLALPLGVGWLTATFVALTMQGWWWPGRQVVVVLPCAVIGIAWWASGSRARLITLAVSGGVGIASLAWLVVEGLDRRLTWVVDFFTTSNPLYRIWRSARPDYLDVTSTTWVLHGLWILLLALVGLWAWHSRPATTRW